MKEDKAFFLKWYGPFGSREELRQWEGDQKKSFCVYLLHGKKKYAKKSDCCYIGISERLINARLNDKNHHINEIFSNCEIYVGCISNFKRVLRKDLGLVEHILTSYTGWRVGEKGIMNVRKRSTPATTIEVCITNRWYKKDGMEYMRRRKAAMRILPEVMVYRYEIEGKFPKMAVCHHLMSRW